MKRRLLAASFATACVIALGGAQGGAQSGTAGGALVFDTYTPGPCSPNGQPHGGCPPGTRHRFRIVPVATGLASPWHLAFLPDGRSMLITELPGQLRIVRGSGSAPELVSGWPDASLPIRTVHSVLVHPQFAQNHFVYLTYVKADNEGRTTMALARGRLNDRALTEVTEVFVADAWVKGGPISGRAAFGPDGMIYFSVNDHDPFYNKSDSSVRMLAQDLGSDVGKVLRLRDDGKAPSDNPFVGRAGAKPEIFTYGHRNVTGFAWHPDTGALWACEIGPMGGDEVNILVAGRNYGWPVVSLGKIYNNTPVSEQSWWRAGMEMPVMYWMPSISPSGLTFYTGDRLPWWRGHLFLGALNGQQLQRVAFNQPEQSERRESLLMQLDARIRQVVQGADGHLYLVTERRANGPGEPGEGEGTNGIIYRIEPAE